MFGLDKITWELFHKADCNEPAGLVYDCIYHLARC